MTNRLSVPVRFSRYLTVAPNQTASVDWYKIYSDSSSGSSWSNGGRGYAKFDMTFGSETASVDASASMMSNDILSAGRKAKMSHASMSSGTFPSGLTCVSPKFSGSYRAKISTDASGDITISQ